jgi:hypothetical protein
MQPKGIREIVRVGMLSAAVLVVVSGAGLGSADGVVEAQRNGNPKPPPTIQTGPATMPSLEQPSTMPVDPMRAHIDEERLKAMNDDRHKKLALDVDRLLTLSNELKTDLDKANKDELSVTVIRKAAEIEKLAHDVQSRMKN